MKLTGSLAVFLWLSSFVAAAAPSAAPASGKLVTPQLAPIVFEPLPRVPGSPDRLVGRIPGAALAFSDRGLSIQVLRTKQKLQIGFAGSSSQARVRGDGRLPSETNYLIGSSSAGWRTHVANYSRVAYSDLYPGIDGVFYGNGLQLEHDFLVRPGADYRQIRLKVSPQAQVTIAANGDLLLALADGELRMRRPTVYQDGAHGRVDIQGAFAKRRDGTVGFAIGSYDRTRALVIDPVLTFSTYLADFYSDGNRIAADAAGATYMTGFAELGYPVTPGAFAGCKPCTQQEIVTYVSKYSVDGKTLLYSTLLGASLYTEPFGIAVDGNGNAIVAGYTQATDFPTKNGQAIGANNNASFAFLTSLSADGASLNYSTLLGGSKDQSGSTTEALALTVDSTGNAYVSGFTDASAFPITPGAVQTVAPAYPEYAVFVSKFTPSGGLVYSGIVGDANPQNGGGGLIGVTEIAVDGSGSAYLAGQAGTLWPVTAGAYQQQISGTQPYSAPFVTKVSPDGSSIVYSTFFGPQAQITGLAVLPDGNVWLAGNGASSSEPITSDAYQSTPASTFLSELDATGSHLVYSTYFGDQQSAVNGLAADADGDIWIAGKTGGQLPLVKPLQSTVPIDERGFGSTSFISQFDPAVKTLKFSTLLGGTASGQALGIALDAKHRAHVGGVADAGFYSTPGAYLGQVSGGSPTVTNIYGYAAVVDPAVDAPALCVNYLHNPGFFFPDTAAGTTTDQLFTLTSCGALPLTITSIQTANGAFSVPADLDQCPQTLPVGQSCTAALRFAPTAKATYSSTVTVVSNAPVPDAVVALQGNGVVPQISASNVYFNYTLVGQTSAAAALFLDNSGGASLTLDYSKTAVLGDFALTSNDCTTILPSNACRLTVIFTPKAAGHRTGTLQIASNDPVNPVLSVPLQATAYSAAPVPQITALDHPTLAAGSTGITLGVSGVGFLPTSVVQVNGQPQKTSYSNPEFISASLDAAVIPATGYGEMPVTVVTPAPGGGTSNPYTITLYDRILTQNASLIYEPIGKKLYASVPANGLHNANTVLPIDPVTITVGTPIPVGNDPAALAASTDGKYLYVALNAAHSLQRINLATGAIERTFALPTDPYYGALTVRDLHAVPGSPASVVAVLSSNSDPSEDGIALFNDAGLVNYIPGIAAQYGMPSVTLDRFTFNGTDASQLYGLPFDAGEFFTIVTLDSSGLHYTRPTGGNGSNPPSGLFVSSDGTLLYTNTGEVWDPKSKQLIHTYPLGTSSVPVVVPDTPQGRTYFLDSFYIYDQRTALAIRGFDQSTTVETGQLAFPLNPQGSFPLDSTDLQRWGTNGFAFRFSDYTTGRSQDDSVVLLTSSIASAGNLNPAPSVTTLAPATLPAAGADFTLTVTGAGFIPGSTVQWNGTPRLTTFVSATTLTAAIYASDIAEPGMIEVSVVSPGPGGGLSSNVTFTVTGGGGAPPPHLSLTPGSLTFGPQTVGTSSAAQSVTLQNAGQSDITGIAISLYGNASSFSPSGTCSGTLATNTSCQINVIFTPADAGSATASLTIASSAAESPQSVSLSGMGTPPSFSITPPPNGSSSTTVASGQTAEYNLVLTPAASYSGTLALSCGNLPAHAACTFTPATLSLTNGSPANFSVAISTTDAHADASSVLFHAAAPMLGLCLVPLWLIGRKPGRRAMLGGLGLMLLVATGCGGSSGNTAPSSAPSAAKVAPGTYTVQLIATDGVTTSQTPVSLIVQ